MKYCIRKPQMTAGAYRKANRVARSRHAIDKQAEELVFEAACGLDLQKGEKIGQVTPHAIDKQAEELVFEAACGLDSAIGSPRQRRCTCLQTGGLPLLFPRLVDASG